MWKLMLLAGAGGFVGTCARFLVNNLFLRVWKLQFPLATFTVNILGCFIFGLISGILQRSGIISPRINAILIVGFCGGFTTFSTFSAETFNLFNNGLGLTSVGYICASILAGVLAVWFGLAVAR